MTSTEKILSLLPQTQCGQCGFPGCRPYAEAVAAGIAAINLCPPGGIETLNQLATLTEQDPKPLEAELAARLKTPHIAKIREAECIGCTKCLKACPVDAIFGAAKQMHVILGDECTGCELCIDPCPVDCIDLIPVPQLEYNKRKAQIRYEAKLKRGDFQRAGMLAMAEKNHLEIQKKTDRKQFIADAIARVKAKKI